MGHELIEEIKKSCYHIPTEFCKSNEMINIYIKGITNGRNQALQVVRTVMP